jgi:hypothetical protein
MTDGAAAVCLAAAVYRCIIADAMGCFQPIGLRYNMQKRKEENACQVIPIEFLMQR